MLPEVADNLQVTFQAWESEQRYIREDFLPSLPEYLKLRFDEKTRAWNAGSFAVMTVFSSGVSMYAMGKLLQLLLHWDFSMSVLLSATIVLAYTFLGGLTSAIYNEVLQFFLIVLGFFPLVTLGLVDVGGWQGLKARLATEALARGAPAASLTSAWRYLGDASQNPMGVEWFGLVMGLGFVLSFGYWCTDFLVVQRAMVANSMAAARRTHSGHVSVAAGHSCVVPCHGSPHSALAAGCQMSGIGGSVATGYFSQLILTRWYGPHHENCDVHTYPS